MDSVIQRQTDDIYEILLLTKYCRSGGLIQLMNDRLAQNSRLAESECLQIFCDLCEAVADLHQAGIIHRDIKIENILIDRESSSSSSSKSSSSSSSSTEINFVLCDFGSATTRTYLPGTQQYSNASIQALADEIQKYTTLAYRLTFYTPLLYLNLLFLNLFIEYFGNFCLFIWTDLPKWSTCTHRNQ